MTYSIILPVRNGGEYVKECVSSILGQSHRDFNLLVLDNCSTDGTPEWVGSLGDSRIKLLPADRPLGIEDNWGRITRIEKNEFITLIGHDDILFPDYLETMDRLIRKHPEATLYQSHFKFIDADGRLIRRCKPMDERQNAPEFLSTFLVDGIDVMGTGFMMRSADYDRLGGLPPYPNLLFADFDLWLTLTAESYKATTFSECFAFRRHSSMTTTSADIKMHAGFSRFVDFLAGLRHKDPLAAEALDRYAETFIWVICRGLAHRILRTPVAKRQGVTVKSFLLECKQHMDKLVPGNSFDPESIFSIRFARQIDANPLSRNAFLLFKRLYSKPLYK